MLDFQNVAVGQINRVFLIRKCMGFAGTVKSAPNKEVTVRWSFTEYS